MAQNPRNPLIKRFLDAGVAFTSMTQSRAEAIVKDLVKTGEVQTEQAQRFVQELVDRSQRNTDRLLEQVRSEVRKQVQNLGLATQDDIKRLEKKISASTSASKKRAAKKKASRAKQSPKKA